MRNTLGLLIISVMLASFLAATSRPAGADGPASPCRAPFARSTERQKLFERLTSGVRERSEKLSRLLSERLYERFRMVPESQQIRAAIAEGHDLLLPEPFHLQLRAPEERNGVLRIAIPSIQFSSSDGTGTVAYGEIKKTLDMSFAKVIVGLLDGATERALSRPSIREVEIVADSVVNPALVGTLQEAGFDVVARTPLEVDGHTTEFVTLALKAKVRD